jgi:hypothetical protein
VAGDLDPTALGDVVSAPQPGPAHATAVEHVRERPLARSVSATRATPESRRARLA